MNRVLVPLRLDGAAPPLGARTCAIGGETMGTTWQVRWVASEPLTDDVIRAAVTRPIVQFPELVGVNGKLQNIKPGPLAPQIVHNYWEWRYTN